MGDGEFIGNQSIHWRIDHGQAQNLTVVQGSDDRPTRDHEVRLNRRVQGRDPRRGDQFRVVLRFDSVLQAQQALDDALKSMDGKDAANVYVTVTLPALRRTNPANPPAPEVRVSW